MTFAGSRLTAQLYIVFLSSSLNSSNVTDVCMEINYSLRLRPNAFLNAMDDAINTKLDHYYL